MHVSREVLRKNNEKLSMVLQQSQHLTRQSFRATQINLQLILANVLLGDLSFSSSPWQDSELHYIMQEQQYPLAGLHAPDVSLGLGMDLCH